MGQNGFLIDSNVIIDFLAANLPEKGMNFASAIIDAGPKVSVISQIEVLGFNTSEDATRILTTFFQHAEIIHLSARVVSETISLRKNHRIKIPDAIIAASCISNDLILITRNINDFRYIPNVNVINPWEVK